jgi:hypothetical protein
MDRGWATATGWLKHLGQQPQMVWSTAGDCNPIATQMVATGRYGTTQRVGVIG